MRDSLRQTVSLGALTVLLCGLVGAQPPEAPKAPPPVQVPKAPPDEPQDPTEPSPQMKDALRGKSATTASASKGPSIMLRGRILSHDKPALAILEVDGKYQTIARGSTLLGPNNSRLKVLEITSQEVRIEVGPLKEVLVFR